MPAGGLFFVMPFMQLTTCINAYCDREADLAHFKQP